MLYGMVGVVGMVVMMVGCAEWGDWSPFKKKRLKVAVIRKNYFLMKGLRRNKTIIAIRNEGREHGGVTFVPLQA